MARPEDVESAEVAELRDDLRLVLRAVDIEVVRLVGVIERVEALVRGPRVQTPAARPASLAALREPSPDGS